MRKLSLLIGIVLLSVTSVKAQTVRVQLTDGHSKWYQPLPVPHKTADKAFWASTLISAAFTIGDIENSIHVLKQPGVSEDNPIYGKHPGRGLYYGISAPIFGFTAFLSYRAKREDDALAAAHIRGHKYVKWWLYSGLNTASHAFGILTTVSSTGE